MSFCREKKIVQKKAGYKQGGSRTSCTNVSSIKIRKKECINSDACENFSHENGKQALYVILIKRIDETRKIDSRKGCGRLRSERTAANIH